MRAPSWIRRAPARFIDLIYPRTCEVANVPLDTTGPFEHFSNFVRSRLVFIADPICDRCGKPLPGLGRQPACEDCLGFRNPRLRRARSAVLLNDASRHLVVRLKYERQRWIAPDIARGLLSSDGVRAMLRNAVVVPIPLAPVRLRERGFNQALLIARVLPGLAPELGIEVREALTRIRETPAQAYAARTRRNRMQNVRNAFAAIPDIGTILNGKRVVLLDDVHTTGATFEAAATALHRVGISPVDAVAFAHG